MFRELFPFNKPPVIQFPVKHEIFLTDTTLREGQQGWRILNVKECLRILEALSKLGGEKGLIKTTEVFLYTSKDIEVVKEIIDYNLKYPKPIAWIRSTHSDLNLVDEAGLDSAVILTSISDYHIKYKLGMDRDQAINKYLSVIQEAFKKGFNVTCSLEDTTRSDIEGLLIPFIGRVLKLAEKYHASVKFKLADTLGLGLPFSEVPAPRGIPKLIELLLEKAEVNSSMLEFHGHNDFHLAVANHLAAWLYGATYSNCTLLGIGERAGNCPLEAMALLYSSITGDVEGVNLKAILETANIFREMGYDIPLHHPIVGENAFKTRAGIHIDGLIKNPEIYLPLDPREILNVPIKVALDAYSGKSGIIYWLKTHFNLDSDDLKDLKSDPRIDLIHKSIAKIYSKGRVTALRDDEVMVLVRKCMPELVEKASVS